MPLIVLSGYPSSGKTKRALELKKYFEEIGKEVHVVSEEEEILKAGFEKNDFYKDDRKEKDIRALLKSEVTRLISPRNLVILDGSNYIKGYRYELYCAMKANSSTQCTIYSIINNNDAWKFNEARENQELIYEREVFDALIYRFEEPDSRSRWDKPLFTVLPELELDYQAISDCLFDKKAPPKNMSTQNAPLTATSFLYDMNKIVKEITNKVISLINKNSIGLVNIPGYPELEIDLSDVAVSKVVSLSRQYIVYSKMNTPDLSNVPMLYIQYLRANLN